MTTAGNLNHQNNTILISQFVQRVNRKASFRCYPYFLCSSFGLVMLSYNPKLLVVKTARLRLRRESKATWIDISKPFLCKGVFYVKSTKN